MIRVSVNRGEAAEVHEFAGLPEAREFTEAAVFWPDMLSLTWETVKPCDHVWSLYDCDDDKATFICAYGCKDTRVVTQAQITEIGQA